MNLTIPNTTAYDDNPILVKLLSEDCMPRQANSTEWFDLATSEDVHLLSGDFALINLGVCIKLPHGYEAILAPRSSTFKKWGILQTNSIGVIDEAYCGNDDIWRMPVWATREVSIPAGTRIAQFRIQKTQGTPPIFRVDNMPDVSRGGFGSTGD